MIDTRNAPRFRVAKPAEIEHGAARISCTVRNLSVTGAALEVFDQRLVPDAFTLIVLDDGLRLPCRVVWRRDFRIGIVFE